MIETYDLDIKCECGHEFRDHVNESNYYGKCTKCNCDIALEKSE